MREKSPHHEALHEERGTDIMQAIQHALAGLKYGSLEIIIQDSKVVQIERKEKVRFNQKEVKRRMDSA